MGYCLQHVSFLNANDNVVKGELDANNGMLVIRVVEKNDKVEYH